MSAFDEGTPSTPLVRTAPHDRRVAVSIDEWLRVDRVFGWITESSWARFSLVVLALVVVRSGCDLYESIDAMVEFARSFPTPTPSYKSSAVIAPALAHLLGIHGKPGWWALHAVFTAMVFVVAVMLVLRRAPDRAAARVMLVWLALAPGATCLLQLIGHYDVFVVLGATVLGFAAGPRAAFAAGVLVGATNPSQAPILLPAYALVSVGLRRLRPAVAVGFALGASASAAAIAGWHATLGIETPSRASLVSMNALRGIRGFLIDVTSATYTWYALAWILVVAVLLAHRDDRRARRRLALGLVGIPAAASLLTLDGTRVFVCCAWAGFCHLVWDLGERREEWERRIPLTALTSIAAVASILAPAYITWVNGHIHEPWTRLWLGPR